MNFSKPRNSTICSRTWCTRSFSSSSRVTLPWPSTRDTGSMATRRRFSGGAAVSSLSLISVIFDQPMSQFRRLAGDEVGEELPDGVAGRRATGNEVVDLHHFVQRMHLVQRQRQLRIVRDMAVRQPRFGEVHLGQATAQIEVVALRGQAAGHGARTDGDEDFAVGAELAQHMHVLRVADAALDDADVARPAVLDVGA